MKEQNKPPFDQRGAKGKRKKSRKRGNQSNNSKSPEPSNQVPKRNLRPWIIAAVVVAAVIAIPLLAKMAARRTAPADDINNTGQTSPRYTRPIFLDIGTTTCAPCKAMLGVMSELKEQFPGKLEVQFINVNEDRDAARRYGITIIPAQIFYSPEGKELYRHTGFFSTKDVVAKWRELGYDLVGTGAGGEVNK